MTKDQTGQEIASLAEQAGRELLDAVPTLKTADKIGRATTISNALRREQSTAAKLRAVVTGNSSFRILCDGWLQHRNGMGMSLAGQTFLQSLIASYIEGRPVIPIIEEARAFAESRTGITETYVAVAGITVSEAVNLSHNIDLIPWADVPHSPQKELFSSEPVPHHSSLSTLISHQRVATANSVIRIRSAVYQILFPSSEDARAAIKASANEKFAQTISAADVVRCSTALTVSVAAIIGSWSQFESKFVNDLIGGYSYSVGATALDQEVARASSKPTPMDGKSITQLIRKFEEFKDSEKNVIRITLDRLSQALRRPTIVDRAIDLGIALEVMLLHSIGPSDRGEMRFRSSIRGAMFLGEGRPERLDTFKLLREAYDLRSKAVHTGALKKEKNQRRPEQILEEGTRACARIAQKLIKRGSFPDWDDEYVIGEQ